jgi:NADPH:quinone reductase-like Zn-dependent oxidoreductase
LTGGLGADKVVDLAGVGTLPHSYQAVGPGGEVLYYNFTQIKKANSSAVTC